MRSNHSQRSSLLVSSGRSGTNYFLSVYSQVFPNDIVVKEIFRREGDSFSLLEKHLGLEKDDIMELVKFDKVGLWNDLIGKARVENTGAIAKIFYQHALIDDPIWSHIKDETRVIHLIRRSQFDVYVSLQVALKSGKWQDFGREDGNKGVTSVFIDRSNLESFLMTKKRRIEWAREYFSTKTNYDEIFYEDIEESPLKCARAICSIYGETAPDSVSTSQRKQKTLPNEEIVTNYSEVADLDVEMFGYAT